METAKTETNNNSKIHPKQNPKQPQLKILPKIYQITHSHKSTSTKAPTTLTLPQTLNNPSNHNNRNLTITTTLTRTFTTGKPPQSVPYKKPNTTAL